MRKFIQWFLVITVISSIAWMVNKSVDKVNLRKAAEKKITTLPDLILHDVDSSALDISMFSNKYIVLIFFNSSCDHCQYEAIDVRNNVEALSKSNIIFISSETLLTIKAFAKSYGLDAYQNISFAKIDDENATAIFGSISVPHVFIYGPDKILRKEFKGETKVEAILKYLN